MINSILNANTPSNKNKLISIGLSETALKEVGVRVLGAFRKATPHDTVNAAGTFAYHEAIKSLRDLFCPRGWEPCRPNGLELIKWSGEKIMIGVSSADRYTGIDGNVQPTTKNDKGPQTSSLVARNAKQLWLSSDFARVHQKTLDAQKHTWYYLYHVDRKNEEFRSEISLPVNINADTMKINMWKERILLPTIEFTETIQIERPDFAEEVVFDIKRKNNG